MKSMRRCWHMLLAAAGPIIIGSVCVLAAFSDHRKAIGADSDILSVGTGLKSCNCEEKPWKK